MHLRISSALLLSSVLSASASSSGGLLGPFLSDLDHLLQNLPKLSSVLPKFELFLLPSGKHCGHNQKTKVCTVKTHNDGKTDDSSYILSAVKSCNPGGQVLFSKNKLYTIGTALDLSNLKNVDLNIQGYIRFTNDTDYWQANSFKYTFQNASTFFKLGGEDVNVYGGGTLDGQGQAWYDLYAANALIIRPILFGTVGLNRGSISNLNLVYSPQWYNFVTDSKNVVFSNIYITGASTSKNMAKNTDGWDTYRSSGITIQNSTINNGDDCVSFKPNSTSILVQNLNCNGSHGISVGSLGQYAGEVDIVQDLLIRNITMSNASDGARIKVWPGVASALSDDLQGGGGTGRVHNVTYDGMKLSNVDLAIEVTQCYGQKNLTLCQQYPSSLTISNVTFKNFEGTVSKKYTPFVGTLFCSSSSVCDDFTTENINVRSPSNTNLYGCVNLGDSHLQGLNCTANTTLV